jgi:1-acyl-sn-glycerol-3-phosphate acyltransferase
MRVAVLGFNGPLAAATQRALQQRGHQLGAANPECVIFLPGELRALEELVSRGGFRRLVLRSHAYAYGSNSKNPGQMTEERVSLLPGRDPAHRWLRAEEIASRFPNAAAVRLVNVLAPEEGDVAVRQLASRFAAPLAGHDPNLQFISLDDAARALVAAAEADATGIFNAGGDGAIPLHKAYSAAGTRRLPLPRPLAHLLRGRSHDQIEYNWTVSGERAARELAFRPEKSTVEALREFLSAKPGARRHKLAASYDDWGLDVDYIRLWGYWFAFLRHVYWRVEQEGMENIPATSGGVFISNHRGFMPLDAVIHLYNVFAHTGRVIRFLIIPSLLNIPYLCNFLTKLGGVVASQENAARLFAADSLVGIFPEGIRGTFTPYKRAYKLRDFARSAFVKIAIENQAPIIPAAVVGHAEIFPILARIDSAWVTRELGWPYLPIAPMFPLAPVPLPSKWHIRILEPVQVTGLSPADAENVRLVRELSRHVQAIVQANIDDMCRRRRRVFWGRFMDGTHPPASAFDPAPFRAAAETARPRAAAAGGTVARGGRREDAPLAADEL